MNRSKVLTILIRVDPFLAPADEPPFNAQDIRELAEVPNAEDALVAVAGDDTATPALRYAAAEALLDGRFVNWRLSAVDSRAVAEALAVAMCNDTTHNRWGLPGQFTGRLGKQLLSLSEGVVEALVPLLDEYAELHIEGSEAATLHSTAHYRIADLAAYLLSQYRGLPWEFHMDMAQRDQAIATLRAKL